MPAGSGGLVVNVDDVRGVDGGLFAGVPESVGVVVLVISLSP